MSSEQKNIKLDLRSIKEQSADAADKPAELLSREMPVRIRYLTPEGEQLECKVFSRVLDGNERAQVARMEAKMAGGEHWECVSEVQRMRFHMLAVIAVQIRDYPEWLMKWIQEDDALLAAIHRHCEVHDLRYFRRDTATGLAIEKDGWMGVLSEIVDPSEQS